MGTAGCGGVPATASVVGWVARGRLPTASARRAAARHIGGRAGAQLEEAWTVRERLGPDLDRPLWPWLALSSIRVWGRTALAFPLDFFYSFFVGGFATDGTRQRERKDGGWLDRVTGGVEDTLDYWRRWNWESAFLRRGGGRAVATRALGGP